MVAKSGAMYTFGWSKYGQLGHGDEEDHLVPHRVEALREHTIRQVNGQTRPETDWDQLAMSSGAARNVQIAGGIQS